MPLITQNLFFGDAISIPTAPMLIEPRSIFFGQQNTRRRAVGFGNHPELVPHARVIGAQEPEAVLE
jgi:hypothetical protein